MSNRFEIEFYENFYRLKRQLETRPLVLGGTSGEDGGSGGPSGGFIGWLPQNRVAYDSTQASSNVIPPSGASLVDNLNYIRWRIDNIIVSGGMGTPLEVQEDDSTVRDGVDIINFEGNVNVTDDGLGKVTVTVPDGTDQLVRVRSTDSTADYLRNKIAAGSNVSISVLNSGANEQLQINSTFTISGGLPGTVYVTGDDPIPSFLSDKIRTEGFVASVGQDNEIGEYLNLSVDFLTLSGTPSSFEGQNDRWLKVNAQGTALEFAELPESSQDPIDEMVKVSAQDQTNEYLETKIVAGNNVAVTKINTGGNEQLRISAALTVSGGGTLSVEEDGSLVATSISTLNFAGDATVIDDGNGTATITISGGGGDGLSLSDHLAIGDNSPHHAPVTLGVGSDPALELNGQELTLTLPVSSGSGVSTFLELTDTPANYAGQAGKSVVVNSGETGLEFVVASGGGTTTFLGLTDTPSSYTANRYIQTNAGATGLQTGTFDGNFTSLGQLNFSQLGTFVGQYLKVSGTIANAYISPSYVNFRELSDTPTTFVAQAGKSLRVNEIENALEFIDVIWSGDGVLLNQPSDYMRELSNISTDFHNVATTANPPFTLAAIASGTLIQDVTTIPTGDPVKVHPGVGVIRASASANSGYYIKTDSSILLTPNIIFECTMMSSSLSDTTAYAGFHSSTSTAVPAESACFRIYNGAIYAYVSRGGVVYHNYSLSVGMTNAWRRLVIRTSPEWRDYNEFFPSIARFVYWEVYDDNDNLLAYYQVDANYSQIPHSRIAASVLGWRTTAGVNNLFYVDWLAVKSRQEEVNNYVPKEITYSGDEFVKISEFDTTADYLQDKILAGAGITITKSGTGAYESLYVESDITSIVTTFAELSDTPNTYTDHQYKVARVNFEENGLEFVDISTATSNLVVSEEDGSPTISGVSQIIVPSGSLTDLGGGVVSLASLGGSGITNLLDFQRNTPFVFYECWSTYQYHVEPFQLGVYNSGTIGPQTSEINHPGIFRIDNSSSGNGGAYMLMPNMLSGLGSYLKFQGGMEFEIMLQIKATQLNANIGFHDQIGVSFFYSNVFTISHVTGEISGYVHKSTASEYLTTASSYAPTLDTWYRLNLKANNDYSRTDYYIYNESGTLLWHDYIDKGSQFANYSDQTRAGVFAQTITSTYVSSPTLYIDYIAVLPVGGNR